LPEGCAATGTDSTGEHDVTGQVAGFGSEAVVEPRTHRGQPELAPTALHQQLAGVVVELGRSQAANQQQVVGDTAEMRKKLREFHTALAMLAEAEARPKQPGGVLLDEGEADFLEQGFGHRLPVLPGEHWLGVEQVDMAGGTGHEDEDAALGTRFEVCPTCGSGGRGRGEQAVVVQSGTQADRTKSAGGGGQEFTPGQQGGRNRMR